jgi:hypothetical protein
VLRSPWRRGSCRAALGHLGLPAVGVQPAAPHACPQPLQVSCGHPGRLRSPRDHGDHGRRRGAHGSTLHLAGCTGRIVSLSSAIQRDEDPAGISKSGSKGCCCSTGCSGVGVIETRDAQGFVGRPRDNSSSNSGPAGITRHRRDGPPSRLPRCKQERGTRSDEDLARPSRPRPL